MSSPAVDPGSPPVRSVTAPTLSDSDLEGTGGQAKLVNQRNLGRYQDLRELGRGGMGIVLQAYDSVLDRRVALKLLGRDLDEQRAKRQLREAQALARLSHPHVITVYEVGRIEGQSFIAMELVEGQTLRQWHQFPRPWPEVLDAYLQAGRGLVAVHAQGLVHRDFKPSNCLIDATGRVRVADFGLASDVELLRRSDDEEDDDGAEDSERAPSPTPSPFDERLTRPGALVGTLAYMSPEQRKGAPWDARGDQYSYCASVWEALMGERERPTSPEPSASTASTRRVPRALRRALLRGMADDPAERWPSMVELLRALERCRSAGRRRRWALALLGTNAAVAAMLWVFAPQAEPPCRRAREHLRGVWDVERAHAVDAAILATDLPYAEDARLAVRTRLDAYAEGWVDMHTQTCEAARVHGELSATGLDQRMACLETRRSALDHAVEQLLETDPEVVEQAVRVVAGLPSLPRCADALALQAEPMPPATVAAAVADLREDLARARTKLQAGKYDEGLRRAEAAFERAQRVGFEPVIAEARMLRGELHQALGHYPEAAADLRAAHALALRHDHAEVAAEAGTGLVFVVGVPLAQPEGAALLGDSVLALAQRVDAEGSREAEALLGVAQVLAKQGQDAEAETHFTRALTVLRAAAVVDPLDTVGALDGLRGVLRRQGRHEEAERLAREAVSLVEQELGAEHPAMVHRLANLATVLVDEGHHAAAEQELLRARKVGERSLRPDHPALAHVHSNLGAVLLYRGRNDEARVELERALALWQQALSPQHDLVADVLVNLGVVARGQGRPEDAEHHYREALQQYAEIYDEDHPRVAMVELNLGKTLQVLERTDEAAEHLERARAAFERYGGPDHPDVGKALAAQGLLEHQQGHLERARQLQQRALEVFERAYSSQTSHPRIARAAWALGRTELELGRVDLAEDHLERALQMQEGADARPVDRAETELALAELRWRTAPEQARALAHAALARLEPEHGEAAERLRAELERWLRAHR
ncbi:serine/threonine-protein kinase [Paraliomyxa miuraensis]|uniref:serine/threonine-protein kinase n=1 Tax=Paraliomyxa miuraensis TaxID=376150 RepID=UPI002254830C|nr:serine/threonine-protein kinase [Paraliomyxa miuraensis]MCX4246613.1 serine/threonine-protein kinase [Paraliomyxa miuraensis]